MKARTALITGAASGIGRASARLFASEGAAVVAFDRADAVHETAEMVRKDGGRAISITGDAGEESEVEAAVAKAVDEFGSLDIAFANAGVSGGLTGLMDQTRRLLAGSAADQPCRPVPDDQARRQADGGAGAGLDHLHSVRRGSAVRGRRFALQRLQGRGDQSGADVRSAAGRDGYSRERHLPRPDRDRA